MNWNHVPFTFIAGLVLLGLARTFAVSYALFVHPLSDIQEGRKGAAFALN
jgi:hypothetical protein